jgi:uncharacterized membrane protein
MAGSGEPVEDDERGTGRLGRLLTFSDGVFAIAIMILVLDLSVPAGLAPEALPAALGELTPRLLGSALSFAIIARFWIAHHALFDHIRSADATLLALGTVLLAPIVLLPFATELLAEYADTAIAVIAVIAYSITVAAAALAELAVLAYGTRRRALGHPRSAVVRAQLVGAGAAAAFLIAVPGAGRGPAHLALVPGHPQLAAVAGDLLRQRRSP